MIAASSRALRPGWRAARVGALGGSSLVLASSAHLLGGGLLPTAGVLAVLALLLGLIALPLTGRRCGTGVLLVALGLEQVGLHVVLGAGSAAHRCPPSGPPGVDHHIGPAGCQPVVDTAATFSPSPAMWFAHLLATLATGWLLARGEAWVWRQADTAFRAATVAPTRLSPATRPIVLPAPMASPAALTHRPAAPRGPPPIAG